MNRRDLFKMTLTAATATSLPNVLNAEEVPAQITTDSFEPNGRWTVEKARAWGKNQPWIVGCNYVPTYAVNQIEMWQKLTFDPKTLDSELALAERTGFNTLRIFVHDLLWREQKTEFYVNVRAFLDLCEKHKLQVIFNFFTNGGFAPAVIGPQPAPKPYTHNSQWRQTPGKDAVMNHPEKWGLMEDYVTETMELFREDPRIRVWDLFNEPANSGDRWMTLGFLRLIWTWARKVNPVAPITSAIQGVTLTPIAVFLAENSDVISFHCYGDLKSMKEHVEALKPFNRPLICKEWMARPTGSTVKSILPYMKEQNVGAINWGLIPGKLQTHYPWGWGPEKGEPKVWHHDLYHEDHTPYDPEEIALFQKLSK